MTPATLRRTGSRCFLNGLSCNEVIRGVYAQLRADRIFGNAAQLSFYFLLSIFPLLICITALLGYFLEVRELLKDAIQHYLRAIAPESAAGLLNRTLFEISSAKSASKISFGLLGSLWVGSSGVRAIIKSLNVAYEVKEFRPWWKQRLVAMALALAEMALVIVLLALLFYGGKLIEQFAADHYLAESVVRFWKFMQWLIVFCLLFLAFYGVYLFAPNVKHARFRHLVPGTFCAVLTWLAISFGFKMYLLFFNHYTMTYGSMGAVIILLLWFYFSGIAILIGGEINSVVERGLLRNREKGGGAAHVPN